MSLRLVKSSATGSVRETGRLFASSRPAVKKADDRSKKIRIATTPPPLEKHGVEFSLGDNVRQRSLRSRRNVITCNLALCLLCVNILVQTGLRRLGTTICTIISGVLQYCVLAAFMWMLLEGILLYRMVIVVFENKLVRTPLLYGISYGIPFVIVLCSSTSHPELMIRENFCWPSAEKGQIWSVIAPICLIVCVNLIIFILTLRAASRIDKIAVNNSSCKEKKAKLVKRLKGMTSLMCLLGISWAVGFFWVPDHPEVAAYPFVILNGLQGVFLFVTQLLLNDHVKEKLILLYKGNRFKFTSVTNHWGYFATTAKAAFKNRQCGPKDPEFSDTRPPELHRPNIYPSAPEISVSNSSACAEEMYCYARTWAQPKVLNDTDDSTSTSEDVCATELEKCTEEEHYARMYGRHPFGVNHKM